MNVWGAAMFEIVSVPDARFLPFQLSIYFPVQLILGKLSLQQVLVNYAWGIVWILVGLGLFSLVWRQGVKRFSAVGA